MTMWVRGWRGRASARLRFATELAADHDVTLVVPFKTDLTIDDVAIVQDDPWDPRRMNDRVQACDVVVAQKLPLRPCVVLPGARPLRFTTYTRR